MVNQGISQTVQFDLVEFGRVASQPGVLIQGNAMSIANVRCQLIFPGMQSELLFFHSVD